MSMRTADTAATAVAKRRRWGFFAVCLGNFVVMMDTNIVNLALPHIRASLGGSLDAQLWVVNAYTLTVAALILNGGAIGDRLGNDRAYRLGTVGFAVTSVACGLATTLSLLVFSRVLQGICAAMLLPSLLGLIPQLYPDPKQRAGAVALWGSSGAVALAAGPLVAGVLIDWLSWQAIFFINLPICAAVYVIVKRTISGIPRGEGRPLDLTGQALAVLAMAGFSFALMEGSVLGWTSPFVVGALAAGVLAVPAFIAVEKRSNHPLVPLRLFANRGFAVATANGLLFQFGYFGSLFLFPLYLQTVHHTSALAAGLEFLPITVATALTPPLLTSRVMTRYGLRRPVFLGGLFGVPGCLLVLLCDSTSPYWILGLAMALQGIWSGLTLPPTAALAVANPPPVLSGTASGVFNASRQLGGVLGVAVLGTVAGSAGTIVSGLHAGMAIAAAAVVLIVVLAAIHTSSPRVRSGGP